MVIERTIVLPIRDNSGVSLAREVAQVKRDILTLAGGYSEVKQTGAWQDASGTVYRDQSIRLTTTVDQEQDDAIVTRLPFWCGRLHQICLYTHATPVEASFVYPVTHATTTAA